jgi:hypothetical protein
MTPVERVARALCLETVEGLKTITYRIPSSNQVGSTMTPAEYVEECWPDFKDAASAAINAMDEIGETVGTA